MDMAISPALWGTLMSSVLTSENVTTPGICQQTWRPKLTWWWYNRHLMKKMPVLVNLLSMLVSTMKNPGHIKHQWDPKKSTAMLQVVDNLTTTHCLMWLSSPRIGALKGLLGIAWYALALQMLGFPDVHGISRFPWDFHGISMGFCRFPVAPCLSHAMPQSHVFLVENSPTPLKNMTNRQLGWWHSQYDGKNNEK